MNVLFATTLIPTADHSGGELASLALIEALRQLGHRTTVIGYLRPGSALADDGASVVVENRPIETAASGMRVLEWLAASAARRLPYTSAKFFSRRYGSIVRNRCTQQLVEAVVIDHTQMYWLRAYVPDHIPVVLIMHNAESDLYTRGAAREASLVRRYLYQRDARMLREVEAAASTNVDRIWVLSTADADRMARHERGAPISVMPLMREWRGGAGHIEPTFDIALLATWSWEPNADALRWFMSEVYPLLPSSTTVRVAGAGADWLADQDPRITYCGFVDDASAFLREARVIAVPTRYGGGVETKMFGAIASGRPVIATATATRGLDDLPASVAVADDAPSFAGAIAARLGATLQKTSLEQAAAWWQGRRRAFLGTLDAEMSCLAPVAARGVLGDAGKTKESADGFT
jgi:glycosyltransferase involved in cell wall biosynthesis